MNDIIKKLYDEKLKYNCYCESMQTQKNGVLYLVYLGTSDFIVINNYYGCVAAGERVFNYDTKTIRIKYALLSENILKIYISKLLKKHETNLKTNKEIIIDIIDYSKMEDIKK